MNWCFAPFQISTPTKSDAPWPAVGFDTILPSQRQWWGSFSCTQWRSITAALQPRGEIIRKGSLTWCGGYFVNDRFWRDQLTELNVETRTISVSINYLFWTEIWSIKKMGGVFWFHVNMPIYSVTCASKYSSNLGRTLKAREHSMVWWMPFPRIEPWKRCCVII